MATKDVWDPVVGGFVCKEVDINRRERSVSVDISKVPAPSKWPWLAKIEASIAVARKHTGSLNGRKILQDLVRLITEIRSQANDLEYSRTRADEADKEVERLKAEGKDRAAELRRRDSQIIDLRVRVGDAGPPSLMKMSVELGLSRAKVEELEAELKRLKPDPEVDEWLIFQPKPMYPSEYWWKSPGAGYAGTRVEAHRYTKVEATEIVNERMSLDLQLVHISMDTPTVD